MPAIKLFGRKWLAATDDLVYPGLFEIVIRLVWLVLIGLACAKYYEDTWNCKLGGELVRIYLLGEVTILCMVALLILFIVRKSACGAIMDTKARRLVEPMLTIKILLLLPEIGWNILGTLWIFGSNVQCTHEHYTVTVVEALVFFDWLLIGLAIFGLALVFDPLGSLGLRREELESSIEHGKVSRIWQRRFKFLCWMRKDESANETFQHLAGLLAALFRGTDLVPSDFMAGCILLRVRQKRETHELRRLNLLSRPKYATECRSIFANTPSWMSLEDALHYLRLAIASYGWLFVMYQHICTGYFRLLKNLTCCACFRRKHGVILDDNCCLCNLSGVMYLSNLSREDILFATFANRLCESPFCVVVDHKTSSIVIIIRGSLSLRDIITDLAAASDIFEYEGLPPGSMAHRSMIISAKMILKRLREYKVLEKAFEKYPQYHLTITGHSLGSGLAVLLAIMLRSRYPNLRVFAFSTPAGLLSREAARVTEEFVLTVGLGDDAIMRLSVDSTENLRIALLAALEDCRLPKYRVILNGFGYALFGVPERDLTKTWTGRNVHGTAASRGSPLLDLATNRPESVIWERDIIKRRYSKMRLYNAGKILHLVRCKQEQKDSKSKQKSKKKYEMRWAQPEEFTELVVMPRMLLDHLPEYIEEALETLIEAQHDSPFYFDP